jgi:hypothetical protein
MHTTDALGGFDHKITRTLSVGASGGPEWIDSTVTDLIPTQMTWALNAYAVYSQRFTKSGASYSHGTNGGSGYLLGATMDSATADYSRILGPNLTLGLTGGYFRTSGLNSNGATSSAYGASQATWQLTQNLIVFANYTGTGQNTTSTLPGTVYSTTFHTISFGLGFSPRESRTRP